MRYLYKYMTIGAAERTLGTATIRCAPMSMMNDPFEGQIVDQFDFTDHELRVAADAELRNALSNKLTITSRPGDKILEAATKLLAHYQSGALADFSQETIIKMALLPLINLPINRDRTWEEGVYQRLSQYIHVFCMSETHDNVLMWSHYADGHTGVVLQFDASDASGHPFHRSRKVNYIASQRKISANECAKMIFGISPFDGEKFIDKQLFTKSSSWEYEKEWRATLNENEVNSEYLCSFVKQDLRGVYFGLRTSGSDRDKITLLVKEKYSWARTYESRRNTADLGLTFNAL